MLLLCGCYYPVDAWYDVGHAIRLQSVTFLTNGAIKSKKVDADLQEWFNQTIKLKMHTQTRRVREHLPFPGINMAHQSPPSFKRGFDTYNRNNMKA